MQTINDVVTSYLAGVAFGVFFGLVCTWFWAIGSIAKALLVQKKIIPWWLVLILGGDPRKVFTKKGWVIKGHVDAFSKGFSIFLLLSFLTFIHYAMWPEFVEMGIPRIISNETSITLFFLLTWGMSVLSLERFLKKLPVKSESDK